MHCHHKTVIHNADSKNVHAYQYRNYRNCPNVKTPQDVIKTFNKPLRCFTCLVNSKGAGKAEFLCPGTSRQ